MDVLTQAAQFILSLSILIVLHEMGHFIPAKLFKTKVEKFYLFFDPWFSLFKVKRGETEYGIGWLPLGGYVKISGMIDESMDKEQMKLPPQPWEFRSKPAWQRLIIMCGGVAVNVILGVLIYAMVLFVWGEEYLPAKNVKYGVSCDSIGYKMGIKDGDKILSVGNKPVENIHKVWMDIVMDDAKSIQVERDGKPVDIAVTPDNVSEIMQSKGSLIEPRFPFQVKGISAGKPASKADIKVGDRVIEVNKIPTPFHNDVTKILQSNKKKDVEFTIIRGGKDTVHSKCGVTEEGFIGIELETELNKFFTTEVKHYNFFASFPAGIHKAKQTFDDYLKQFKVIFTVKGAAKEVGGFISIGKAYSKTWDWERFWTFTGFLSIVLAFMNILPIPALDGGHVMFLLYEVITRRKPNEKVMEYAQYLGMFLLLGLLLYANGNDVVRLFSSK
jgi:regulator of sigma E protease